MKKIIIDGTFSIEVDDNQWILNSTKMIKDKDGKEKEIKKTLGYFSSLESCLNKLIAIKVKQNIDGAISLEEFKAIILKAHSEVHDICEKLKI